MFPKDILRKQKKRNLVTFREMACMEAENEKQAFFLEVIEALKAEFNQDNLQLFLIHSKLAAVTSKKIKGSQKTLASTKKIIPSVCLISEKTQKEEFEEEIENAKPFVFEHLNSKDFQFQRIKENSKKRFSQDDNKDSKQDFARFINTPTTTKSPRNLRYYSRRILNLDKKMNLNFQNIKGKMIDHRLIQDKMQKSFQPEKRFFEFRGLKTKKFQRQKTEIDYYPEDYLNSHSNDDRKEHVPFSLMLKISKKSPLKNLESEQKLKQQDKKLMCFSIRSTPFQSMAMTVRY